MISGLFKNLVQSESPSEAGEAVGQIIECMDGNFEVDESCLIHSDILYDFCEGTYSDILYMNSNTIFSYVIKV